MSEDAGTPTTLEERLEVFVRAVESSPHNLMSRRALDELRSRHVAECHALATMLPAGPADVLDVGSGGGFPGLVIAAARSDLDVTLLEATTKKAQFLVEAAQRMAVEVSVINARAEDTQAELRASFDVVTARAVAPLERLLGWTIPFLRPGGRLYAMKGERWREELAAAAGELRRLGARPVGLPDEEAVDGADPHRPRVVIIAAHA